MLFVSGPCVWNNHITSDTWLQDWLVGT